MKPMTPEQINATINEARRLLDGDPLDAVSLYRGHLAIVVGALDEARGERAELHAALRHVLAALGNGSGATAGASVEFMATTWHEVAAVVGELRRERDEARAENDRLNAVVTNLLYRIEDVIATATQGHPSAKECPEPECSVCAVRDCPHHEWLHYHHDGCPACWSAEQRARADAE